MNKKLQSALTIMLIGGVYIGFPQFQSIQAADGGWTSVPAISGLQPLPTPFWPRPCQQNAWHRRSIWCHPWTPIQPTIMPWL